MRHLDSEYRDRWEEFYLKDGTMEDSRLKNWRDVAWNDVVKIVIHTKDCIHVVNNIGSGFKAFMNFRWGGMEAIFDDKGKYIEHRPVKIWTVGWTDGEKCFLKDIDFYTGELIKNYVTSLDQFKAHLHPDVRMDK